eukprot:6191627-Pyramimonas_sp.AAC.2
MACTVQGEYVAVPGEKQEGGYRPYTWYDLHFLTKLVQGRSPCLAHPLSSQHGIQGAYRNPPP